MPNLMNQKVGCPKVLKHKLHGQEGTQGMNLTNQKFKHQGRIHMPTLINQKVGCLKVLRCKSLGQEETQGTDLMNQKLYHQGRGGVHMLILIMNTVDLRVLKLK